MAVITQNYDIDLKATGEFPVVKMSQFDTGSRTIVFTAYDGHDLAHIDGMVARVDGTRSDGVEFSSTCTVSAGSKVSFTISQEMTKHAGKHAAELVIFDADGNPAGTQNFIIEVEPATMVRDSAASADDRTLYDQFTDSVSKSVADKMASVDSKLASVDDKMAGVDTKISTTVDTEIDKRIKPDPLLGAWSDYTVEGTVSFTDGWTEQIIPLKIKSQSDGADAVYGANTTNAIYIYKPGVYQAAFDFWYYSDVEFTGRNNAAHLVSSDGDDVKRAWVFNAGQGIGSAGARTQLFRGAIAFYVPDDGLPYRLEFYTAGASAVTLKSGIFSQMVITRISSGSDILEQGVNSVAVGTVTTGAAGTSASVVNSGTAKDVVLDFTIPRGADGAGSSYTLPVASASTLGGVKIGSGISVTDDGTISASGGSASFAGEGTCSIAISNGGKPKASGNFSIAIGGSDNEAQGITKASGSDGIAIGRKAQTDSGIAIGSFAVERGYNASIAIGTSSSVGAGSFSSVALGYASVVPDKTNYVVSVGSGDYSGGLGTRRIINVTDPTSDQDAATKAYVDALIAKLKSDNGLK